MLSRQAVQPGWASNWLALYAVGHGFCCHCCCRTAWLSYYRVLGMPVLVALNAADTALAIEALTDEQAVAEAMQVSKPASGSQAKSHSLSLRQPAMGLA